MTLFAIALVLTSAVLHALWNYVAKQSSGGIVFAWLFGMIEMAIFIPVLIVLAIVEPFSISLFQFFFICVASALHVAYFLLLTKGYQVGDLSVVYPLSRAIGPLFSTVGAVILFHESPTLVAIFGTVLICGGVLWLTGNPSKLRQSSAWPGIVLASMTGGVIAVYTLWDSYAVHDLLIAPLVYQAGLSITRAVMMMPLVRRQRHEIPRVWHQDKKKALVVAAFSSGSYLLILIALVFSPVSYVAPMRVISTLIGVTLGTQLLGEGQSLRRLGAAGAMVLGVFALSIG